MTSAMKTDANRRNAKRSGGPKTIGGKKRAAQNAWRHGLSVSPLSSYEDAAWIEERVNTTCGDNPDVEARSLARDIFLAQSTLLRVRRARSQLISRLLNAPDFLSKKQQKIASIVASVEAQIGPVKIPAVLAPLLERHAPQDRYGIILKDFAAQLETIERYENRALSKRRKSIGKYFTLAHNPTSNQRSNLNQKL